MAQKTSALPGMERKVVKEVSDAAEKYVDARDKRIKMLTKEIELKDLLADKMHKNNLVTYRDESLLVEIVAGKEKIKVSEAEENGKE